MLFSNQGSFPPPALLGFCGTTSPSATLPARPALRGVPVGVCAPPTGLPVLLPFPSSMRATATTPAEPVGARVARFPTGGSLPRQKGGSASALLVSGPARRSLALRPAWSLSRQMRPRYIGVLQAMSLPPSPAPIATGWSDFCRAGFTPARKRRLLTAHQPNHLSLFPRCSQERIDFPGRFICGIGTAPMRTFGIQQPSPAVF